ncbi:unnamed protein product [Orchesella dallaii]|uniref:Uncharacterized protein n=1 Tax=Orchesella dallaii TaxID=48710 RepID=A0ABP1QP31_9HEXA
MSIDTLSNVLQAKNDLLQRYGDMADTINQLVKEAYSYMCKRTLYEKLNQTFNIFTPSSKIMRKRVLYKHIQIKNNIIEATWKIFVEKRQRARNITEKVLKFTRPLVNEDQSTFKDLSMEELERKLRDYERGMRRVEGIHTEHKMQLDEWNEMKDELFSVICDNIERLRALIPMAQLNPQLE